MIPLLIAAGLAAAGGAIMNNMAAKREGKRRARAINKARQETAQVSSDQIANNAERGKTEQNALLEHLTRMSSAPSAQAAQDQVAARTAAINARAGSAAPAEDADPLTQAAFARTAATNKLSEDADRSDALLQALLRGDQNSAGAANAQLGVQAAPWSNRTIQNRMRYNQIQSDLDGELGVTGNASANMQLLGSLLNTGANAGFATAGRV